MEINFNSLKENIKDKIINDAIKYIDVSEDRVRKIYSLVDPCYGVYEKENSDIMTGSYDISIEYSIGEKEHIIRELFKIGFNIKDKELKELMKMKPAENK